MTPVPLDLPLRPSEAAELAGLIFESAERKPLTDDVRSRIAARAAGVRFESIVPYFGSLERDPVHHSTYYLAVDVDQGAPQLLHIALATAPTSSIFPKPLLIGRMRRVGGPEIVVNSIPFGPADSDAVEKFATRVNHAFLPRPQGSRTTLVAPTHGAGVFDAFRAIWKRTGRNIAGVGADTGEPAGAAYSAAVWAAIRSGWRDGYTAVARIDTPDQVRDAAGFSTFAFDAAACIPGTAGPGEACNEWALEQFVPAITVGDTAYPFTPDELARLSLRFSGALQTCERIHNQIRQTRSALKINLPFDFELALDRLPAATTPRELLFCLHWLKARGHAVQLVALNLAAAGEPHIRELAAICRHYQCAIDFPAGSTALVESVSRATACRVTCSIWGPQSDGAAVTRVAESLLG